MITWATIRCIARSKEFEEYRSRDLFVWGPGLQRMMARTTEDISSVGRGYVEAALLLAGEGGGDEE
jgi:hypothetical protein